MLLVIQKERVLYSLFKESDDVRGHQEDERLLADDNTQARVLAI